MSNYTTRSLLKLSTLLVTILGLLNESCAFSYRSNVARSEQSIGYQQRYGIKLFALSLDEESKEKGVKRWKGDQEIPWMNLPKTSYNLNTKNNNNGININATEKTAGFSAEIIIGRIAMVGAIFLLSTEVLTGLSLPEQFNQLVISLSL